MSRRRLLGAACTGSLLVMAPGLRETLAATGGAARQSTPAAAAGEYRNPLYGTPITWQAPWSQGMTFGASPSGNETPTFNNENTDAFITFSVRDPREAFRNMEAAMDSYEEGYSTGFLVPFRDGTNVVSLARDRKATSFAILLHYDVEDGRAFDLYDFREDKEGKLLLGSQMSDLAETFEESYLSAQDALRFEDERPFITFSDELVLAAIASVEE